MTYIITNKNLAGKTVYFDGFGFSLALENAKRMDSVEGIAERSAICHEFPSCRLITA